MIHTDNGGIDLDGNNTDGIARHDGIREDMAGILSSGRLFGAPDLLLPVRANDPCHQHDKHQNDLQTVAELQRVLPTRPPSSPLPSSLLGRPGSNRRRLRVSDENTRRAGRSGREVAANGLLRLPLPPTGTSQPQLHEAGSAREPHRRTEECPTAAEACAELLLVPVPAPEAPATDEGGQAVAAPLPLATSTRPLAASNEGDNRVDDEGPPAAAAKEAILALWQRASGHRRRGRDANANVSLGAGPMDGSETPTSRRERHRRLMARRGVRLAGEVRAAFEGGDIMRSRVRGADGPALATPSPAPSDEDDDETMGEAGDAPLSARRLRTYAVRGAAARAELELRMRRRALYGTAAEQGVRRHPALQPGLPARDVMNTDAALCAFGLTNTGPALKPAEVLRPPRRQRHGQQQQQQQGLEGNAQPQVSAFGGLMTLPTAVFAVVFCVKMRHVIKHQTQHEIAAQFRADVRAGQAKRMAILQAHEATTAEGVEGLTLCSDSRRGGGGGGAGGGGDRQFTPRGALLEGRQVQRALRQTLTNAIRDSHTRMLHAKRQLCAAQMAKALGMEGGHCNHHGSGSGGHHHHHSHSHHHHSIPSPHKHGTINKGVPSPPSACVPTTGNNVGSNAAVVVQRPRNSSLAQLFFSPRRSTGAPASSGSDTGGEGAANGAPLTQLSSYLFASQPPVPVQRSRGAVASSPTSGRANQPQPLVEGTAPVSPTRNTTGGTATGLYFFRGRSPRQDSKDSTTPTSGGPPSCASILFDPTGAQPVPERCLFALHSIWGDEPFSPPPVECSAHYVTQASDSGLRGFTRVDSPLLPVIERLQPVPPLPLHVAGPQRPRLRSPTHSNGPAPPSSARSACRSTAVSTSTAKGVTFGPLTERAPSPSSAGPMPPSLPPSRGYLRSTAATSARDALRLSSSPATTTASGSGAGVPSVVPPLALPLRQRLPDKSTHTTAPSSARAAPALPPLPPPPALPHSARPPRSAAQSHSHNPALNTSSSTSIPTSGALLDYGQPAVAGGAGNGTVAERRARELDDHKRRRASFIDESGTVHVRWRHLTEAERRLQPYDYAHSAARTYERFAVAKLRDGAAFLHRSAAEVDRLLALRRDVAMPLKTQELVASLEALDANRQASRRHRSHASSVFGDLDRRGGTKPTGTAEIPSLLTFSPVTTNATAGDSGGADPPQQAPPPVTQGSLHAAVNVALAVRCVEERIGATLADMQRARGMAYVDGWMARLEGRVLQALGGALLPPERHIFSLFQQYLQRTQRRQHAAAGNGPTPSSPNMSTSRSLSPLSGAEDAFGGGSGGGSVSFLRSSGDPFRESQHHQQQWAMAAVASSHGTVPAVSPRRGGTSIRGGSGSNTGPVPLRRLRRVLAQVCTTDLQAPNVQFLVMRMLPLFAGCGERDVVGLLRERGVPCHLATQEVLPTIARAWGRRAEPTAPALSSSSNKMTGRESTTTTPAAPVGATRLSAGPSEDEAFRALKEQRIERHLNFHDNFSRHLDRVERQVRAATGATAAHR